MRQIQICRNHDSVEFAELQQKTFEPNIWNERRLDLNRSEVNIVRGSAKLRVSLWKSANFQRNVRKKERKNVHFATFTIVVNCRAQRFEIQLAMHRKILLAFDSKKKKCLFACNYFNRWVESRMHARHFSFFRII